MNLARRVLEALRSAGVEELIVCPGARNAAFIQALPEFDFRTVWHFEERSAGFFALGRIGATGRPVAVVTTSGTAAGELLPPTMESFYQGLPLVLVTADRPRRFRGSGAPQSAEQAGIFGVYATVAFDLEGDEPFALTLSDRPVHLNVCLEDPRGAEALPSPEPHGSLADFLTEVRAPLVVVGQLAPTEVGAVERFLVRLNAPVYLEALSNLRHSEALAPLALRVGDRLLDRGGFDGVLRLGGVPTQRLWRDLEDRRAALPVLSLSRLPFSGLGRPSAILPLDFAERVEPRAARPDLIADDRRRYACLAELLDSEPGSEPGVVRRLSQRIETGAHVYLGNSLPIREWDLAADPGRPAGFSASRGLNGIDGQLSTFLGRCTAASPNWAVLGDLTTLYDLAGPWPLAQVEPGFSATLVTINNGGGRIFERMFPDRNFLNAHGRSFESWAAMWDLPYQCLEDPAEIGSGAGLRVAEVVPDADATRRFWARYEEVLA